MTGGAGSSGGFRDFWLVKTDASGNMQWQKTYGGTSDDWAWTLVQTSDGGYAIAGYTQSYGSGSCDAWLIRTDGLGNVLWNKTYGNSAWNGATTMVQSSDGGYTLAGETWSPSAGGRDFWLFKTDVDGNILWSRNYGGNNNEHAYSLAKTSDGGYALAGYTYSFGAGYTDYWFVKTDANGVQQWNKTYGGTNYEEIRALVQTSDGGYAAVGYTKSFGAGGSDIWLLRTDSSGNQLWNKTYGGTSDDTVYLACLVKTSDGGYALAGGTRSFGAGGEDFWLIKLAIDSWRGGTIYVRADGSIDPPDAPMSTVDNVTYTLTSNIASDADSIVVDRDDIVVDGAGYAMTGSGNAYGITLTGRSNVTVRKMRIENFDYGIWLEYSSNNALSDNIITSYNGYGIILGYSSGNTLSGNSVANNWDGIWLNYSSNNTLSGNNVTSNSGWGIYLSSSSYNILSGNNVTANYLAGIWLHSSSSNALSGNDVANNHDGIELDYSSGNTLSSNNVTSYNGYGIILGYSSGNTLSSNSVANNYYGVVLGSSSSNTLFGNSVTASNSYGIYLYFSSDITLFGNNVANNGYGVRLDSSSNNNVFYHNNFMNNTSQVYSSGSTNAWNDDYPSGGNYWSDCGRSDLFRGPFQNETGSDGLGDEPYEIDEDNTDQYPLMKPYPWGPHDISISSIATSKTAVGQGFNLGIETTIFNYGDGTETFNVTFYCNETVITLPNGENYTTVTLASRGPTTIAIDWNTSGLPEGNYAISAYAEPVSGEIDVTDNNLTYTWVAVTIPGDVTGDIWVDMQDISMIIDNFMATPPNWNPNCDVNNDLSVDMADISLAIDHFMQT
jgi:parallel beta-helix repeat protein